MFRKNLTVITLITFIPFLTACTDSQRESAKQLRESSVNYFEAFNEHHKCLESKTEEECKQHSEIAVDHLEEGINTISQSLHEIIEASKEEVSKQINSLSPEQKKRLKNEVSVAQAQLFQTLNYPDTIKNFKQNYPISIVIIEQAKLLKERGIINGSHRIGLILFDSSGVISLAAPIPNALGSSFISIPIYFPPETKTIIIIPEEGSEIRLNLNKDFIYNIEDKTIAMKDGAIHNLSDYGTLKIIQWQGSQVILDFSK